MIIKRDNEFEIITTYKKDVESFITAINEGLTINDILSPDKNIKLKDGLIIVIKTIN